MAMIHLTLGEEEAQILQEVLESCISDLSMEIADTDRMEFREILKTRKRTLLKVLEVLRGTMPQS
ncbi:MAG: hypothetical protein HUU32_00585 [Calditrichaceae bacterium]|nr:hypothetical protein [Calditrichia bacterium]NUQ39869.1 hypothetical protein [Calditrichaceae bacterium]